MKSSKKKNKTYQPLVSIIVPIYKVEKYLPRCLDSLIVQTFNNIEIICINDGSPDNCHLILDNYYNKYPQKIVIINKENEGVWKARKDGISKARGKYIGFVDADDYVDKDFVQKMVHKIKEDNADIVVCGYERINQETQKRYSKEMSYDNKIIDMDKNPSDILMINGAAWNKLYKAEVLKKIDDLKQVPTILDDFIFLLLTYLKVKKISFIPSYLVYYMVRSDSIVSNINKKQVASLYKSLLEVKNIYENSNNQVMMQILNDMAFLHLGISLIFRLSYEENTSLKEVIKNNNNYLDNNFPLYKKSPFLKLSYIITHNFKNIKIWIVKLFYKLHLFPFFIKAYKFIISKTNKDFKW